MMGGWWCVCKPALVFIFRPMVELNNDKNKVRFTFLLIHSLRWLPLKLIDCIFVGTLFVLVEWSVCKCIVPYI